jgi:hypothetical protein
MADEKQLKIAYWVYNFMPKWEAASMEVNTLLTEFEKFYDTHLIAQNYHNQKIRFFGKQKFLPLPFSALGAPIYTWMASSFHINHILSSPAEPLLLPRIGQKNTVLTISKDSESLTGFEKNIRHLEKLRFIVAESEWHKELL